MTHLAVYNYTSCPEFAQANYAQTLVKNAPFIKGVDIVAATLTTVFGALTAVTPLNPKLTLIPLALSILGSLDFRSSVDELALMSKDISSYICNEGVKEFGSFEKFAQNEKLTSVFNSTVN